MTLIQKGKGPNPLMGFQVDPDSIRYVGRDLERPECILAERDGTLWSADGRGGIMRIEPNGRQSLIFQSMDTSAVSKGGGDVSLGSSLPNGLAFAANGDILISNFGTDRLERMTRKGETTIILDNIDGQPLGKVNFVLRDNKERLWISISTMVDPWSRAIRTGLYDGKIILIDKKGARVVADGLQFTNEIRLDKNEEWMYVAETTAKHVTRFRVGKDGSLTDREIYGPSSLGTGVVDGICFDDYGNLWGTMIFADRLIAITPQGDALELLDSGDAKGTKAFEAAFATGEPVPEDTLKAAAGKICPWLASVTFGGADGRTVYLGGLRSTNIPTFRSPVAGLQMVHW